ncbi:TY-Chap domain-containing protein [Nocardia sp. NPDC088792]|uniref:TY-Chap domain-containing protein n=1 Tax=Nocardia sp. NPDC088792 TaxID=3364332 RepID=UPI0038279CA2
MSISVDVCFTVYGLSPGHAEAVAALFEQVMREERLENEAVLIQRDSVIGAGVDVRVESPDPVIFSGFSRWQDDFEPQLQRRVEQVAPGAKVEFEWEFSSEEQSAYLALASEPAAPPATWAEFASRLAIVLEAMTEQAAVTLGTSEGSCIQFLGRGFADTGSGFSSVSANVTAEQDRLLAAAGWVIDLPGIGEPNRYRCFSVDQGHFPYIAARAVEAMTEVLQIGSPSQLTVDSFTYASGEPDPAVAALGLESTSRS